MILEKDKDTFLCFNLEQSRRIAKQLAWSQYCDSISKVAEVKLNQVQRLTDLKDTAIFILRQKVILKNRALEKSDEIIARQEVNIRGLSKQLRSVKVQRVLLVLCSILLAANLAVK
jgi:hypothetical protein